MPSILILTQYYLPETGAPQNRLSSLAYHLKESGWDVSVLTAVPNYPKMEIFSGYKGKLYVREKHGDITVHRAWLYCSKSKNVWLRLINYFSFVITALIVGVFKVRKHDVVFCESPPLFLGITAWILKYIKRSKLVFNVSDLWPETAVQLGIIKNKSVISMSTKLENFIYKHSDVISGQTLGIVNNIQSRFPDKRVVLLRNGIDSEKFSKYNTDTSWRSEYGYGQDDFILLYGGILGYAQNLEVILKAAKKLKDHNDIRFVIVGDGPNKENLLEWKHELGLDNVMFLPSQPFDKMPTIISASNAGIIPLRNLPLFKGAIPSKIFEYLMVERPILLGVDGEAKKLFIDDVQCGLYFTPQNEFELADCILKLKQDKALTTDLGKNAKAYVMEKFDRKHIAMSYIEELNTLVGNVS